MARIPLYPYMNAEGTRRICRYCGQDLKITDKKQCQNCRDAAKNGTSKATVNREDNMKLQWKRCKAGGYCTNNNGHHYDLIRNDAGRWNLLIDGENKTTYNTKAEAQEVVNNL